MSKPSILDRIENRFGGTIWEPVIAFVLNITAFSLFGLVLYMLVFGFAAMFGVEIGLFILLVLGYAGMSLVFHD